MTRPSIRSQSVMGMEEGTQFPANRHHPYLSSHSGQGWLCFFIPEFIWQEMCSLSLSICWHVPQVWEGVVNLTDNHHHSYFVGIRNISTNCKSNIWFFNPFNFWTQKGWKTGFPPIWLSGGSFHKDCGKLPSGGKPPCLIHLLLTFFSCFNSHMILKVL